MSKVYLAGPLTGTTYHEATKWREEVAGKLIPAGIQCLSPMRSKDDLEERWIIPRFIRDNLLSSQRSIFCRDRFDVKNCDVVLMNLRHADRISIGSMVEIGWATAYDKPLVVVMDEGNIHDHPFVREAADYIVNNLNDAVLVIKSILEAHA